MTARQILGIVLRSPQFWFVTGGALAVAVAARLLIPGWAGEWISDAAFLGAAFGGGAFARAAAGLPPAGK
jgi:hypothetical protein